MKKSQLKILHPQLALTVVEHAHKRAKRGHGPSMRYLQHTNRQALAAAEEALATLDEDLARWAKSRGHKPGTSYNSPISGIHFRNPEAATAMAGYEAMILSLAEEEDASQVA